MDAVHLMRETMDDSCNRDSGCLAQHLIYISKVNIQCVFFIEYLVTLMKLMHSRFTLSKGSQCLDQ